MAVIIVPDDHATITLALAAMGAADELHIRGGNYAEGDLVVAAGAIIRPIPGDPVPVVVLGDGVHQTWRIHAAGIEFVDIISENPVAASVVYKLNADGILLTHCTARNYVGFGVQANAGTANHELRRHRGTGNSGPAAVGIDFLGATGGRVDNALIDGDHLDGIRPGAGTTVSNPTTTGCTGVGLHDTRGATSRNVTAFGNAGIGVRLNHAAADCDYVRFFGNGTDSQVVAGTLGAHTAVADPLYAVDLLSMDPASPCRDTGVAVAGVTEDFIGTTRPLGADPDIGHLEFPGVPPTVLDAAADGLTAVVVTFDQAMDPTTLGATSGWRLEALISGELLAVASVTTPTTDTARLVVVGAMDPATLYRVTAPATAESALGDLINPAADTADFVTGAFVAPYRTDLWAFLADPTTDASDARLPFVHQFVYSQLFCDARALPEDNDPLADGNPRGWMGDHFNPAGRAACGSRLWTLSRKRLTEEVAGQARTLAEQALACGVTEGLYNAVEVTAEIQPADGGGKRLAMRVVTRRDRGDVTLRFADLWKVFDGNN